MPKPPNDDWEQLKVQLIIAAYCVLSFIAGVVIGGIILKK